MSETREWPRIAVVGAGAVGGYFGGMFARAGAPTVFIGRKHFADAVNSRGLVLDKSEGRERISARATVEMRAVRECSLILLCVKANDTSATAREMAPFVRPDATVVCLQNGVDNGDQVRAATNVASVPAVVYVPVSWQACGRSRHASGADVMIGSAETATDLAGIIIRAGIPLRFSDNIEGELWVKLLRNCALNAVSALGHVRYGQIAQSDDAKKLMKQVVDEVLSVARAAGVVLPGVYDRESRISAALEP